MGADLLTVIHKIPALPPTATDPVSGQLEAYKAIIDATNAHLISEAITLDDDFDVTDFGVDDLEFHDGIESTIEQFARIPEAVTAARRRLYEVAEEYAMGACDSRADLMIGGTWFAFYAGLSRGDEPFEGYGAVSALAELPGLGVAQTVYDPAGLTERVLGGLADDAALDDSLKNWVNANPLQVSGMVETEIGARESVITGAIDAVLIDLEAEVRSTVRAQVTALASQ
jgi:hypothetical protein